MPATAARIGFIQEEFRRVVATTSAAQTRFGNAARKSEDPIPTFFDNVADAQAVANERQALLSAERRRFRATAVGAEAALALDYVGEVPVADFTDSERSFGGPTLVSSIVVDLARQKSTVVLWG